MGDMLRSAARRLHGLNASSCRSAGRNVCIFVVYLRCIYYVYYTRSIVDRLARPNSSLKYVKRGGVSLLSHVPYVRCTVRTHSAMSHVLHCAGCLHMHIRARPRHAVRRARGWATSNRRAIARTSPPNQLTEGRAERHATQCPRHHAHPICAAPGEESCSRSCAPAEARRPAARPRSPALQRHPRRRTCRPSRSPQHSCYCAPKSRWASAREMARARAG